MAHLVSPTCNSSGPLCLRFWYHLYGAATLMSLRLYVAPEGRERRLLWIATGRKGDHWLQASITVPHTGQLKVTTEAAASAPVLSGANNGGGSSYFQAWGQLQASRGRWG